MPEGPEIRRAADRVARVLAGRTVVEANFGLPHLEPFAEALAGRLVTSVDTRGKAMLTRFDNGLTLYSHNQLYGRWYTMPRGRRPKTSRQLRVALSTETHSALLYSASDIDVLKPRELERHPFLARLGPDVMDTELAPSAVKARLADERFARRSLGALYLDQSFVAGLGNYLRSEILFAARVHPRRKAESLTVPEARALARETLTVARRSYRTGGLTVPDREARRLESRGLSFGERRFYVFDREGQPCRRCGSPIEKTLMSSRNLFFCPACQRG